MARQIDRELLLADFGEKALETWLRESNAIEGIYEHATPAQVKEVKRFLLLKQLTIKDIKRLVKYFQPNAIIRDRIELNVRAGNYHPPLGGPAIVVSLAKLAAEINAGKLTPFQGHTRYETLHPFMDGNGRSGRLIWLWQMFANNKVPKLTFLHTFYYQTLDGVGRT